MVTHRICSRIAYVRPVAVAVRGVPQTHEQRGDEGPRVHGHEGDQVRDERGGLAVDMVTSRDEELLNHGYRTMDRFVYVGW